MTTNIKSNTPINLKNEWRTPPEVYNWAATILGGMDFDTACTSQNSLADPICAAHSDVVTDALIVDWFGMCWCNPPYDNIQPWIDKAIASKSAIVAMLIPSPNGESRYSELMRNAHEIVIVGRLAFIGPDGKPVSGNTRGSSLFIINGYAQGSRSFVERDWIMENFK